jgi:hypothetical protein
MNHQSYQIVDDCRTDLNVDRVVIASWTGRDREQVEQRIRELKAIEVKTPSSLPAVYNVSSALVTTATKIEVVGDQTTGEVEAVLMRDEKLGLLVGVGSDHTDRKVESYDVAISKQVCGKPVAEHWWRYEDVSDHWDALIARSWRITASGERILYQEGLLVTLLQPEALIRNIFGGGHAFPVRTVLFCGTQPVIGKLLASAVFEIELFDPVRDRSLRHSYSVVRLSEDSASSS